MLSAQVFESCGLMRNVSEVGEGGPIRTIGFVGESEGDGSGLVGGEMGGGRRSGGKVASEENFRSEGDGRDS